MRKINLLWMIGLAFILLVIPFAGAYIDYDTFNRANNLTGLGYSEGNGIAWINYTTGPSAWLVNKQGFINITSGTQGAILVESIHTNATTASVLVNFTGNSSIGFGISVGGSSNDAPCEIDAYSNNKVALIDSGITIASNNTGITYTNFSFLPTNNNASYVFNIWYDLSGPYCSYNITYYNGTQLWAKNGVNTAGGAVNPYIDRLRIKARLDNGWDNQSTIQNVKFGPVYLCNTTSGVGNWNWSCMPYSSLSPGIVPTLTTVHFINAYDGSSINDFNVTAYNGSNTLTSIVTNGSAYFVNLTGFYTFNISIPYFYEDFKQIIVNTSGGITLTNTSIQSIFNVSAFEFISNISLSGFGATNINSTNATAGSSLFLVTNNASQIITLNKTGYFNATATATAASGQVTNVNITGLYSNFLNINATNALNNNTISSFIITLSSLNYSYVATSSTTTGNANFTLVSGSYNLTFNSSGYEMLNAIVNVTTGNAYPNYTFSPYYQSTLLVNLYDQQLNQLILSSTIISLYNSIVGTSNYTMVNGSIVLSNLTSGFYTATFTNPSYYTNNYFVTIPQFSHLTLNAYMINATGANVQVETVNVKSDQGFVLSNVTITLYKNFNSSYLPVQQATTDSQGNAVFYMDTTVLYQITFAASGYDLKTTTLKAINPYTSYFILSGTTKQTFQTIYNTISRAYYPTSNIVKAGYVNFSYFVTSSDGTLDYFGLYSNATGPIVISNLSGYPNGGIAYIVLNLTNATGRQVPIYYFIKSVNYPLYSESNIYYVTSNVTFNNTGSLLNAMYNTADNTGKGTLIIYSIIGIMIFTAMMSILFEGILQVHVGYWVGVASIIPITFFAIGHWLNEYLAAFMILIILLSYGFFLSVSQWGYD